MLLVLSLVPILKQRLNITNKKYQINKYWKPNSSFFKDMINIEDFYSSFLKMDKIWVFITLHRSHQKNWWLIIGEVHGFIECNSIEEKDGDK